MFDRDFWHEVKHTLLQNKLRTFLTAFGVLWGIIMLIILLGAGQGLQNGVQSEFGGMATNSIYLWGRSTSKPHAGLPPGRWIQMRVEDGDAMVQQVPGIEVMAPRAQLGGWRGGNNVSRGNRTAAFDVMGDFPQFLNIQPMNIEQGRFINEIDIEQKRKVAIIGARARQVLFAPGEEIIGESIRINGVYFMVVGYFTTNRSGGQAEQDEQTIYIPFTTFQTAFNFGNRVGWFAFTADSDVSAEEVQEDALAVMRSRHRVAPDDMRAFGSFNAKEEFDRMNNLFGAIQLLIWIVGTGTLAAGVIGVSNILLIVIRERTTEIGVRRALGATPRNIVVQVVVEAMVLTVLAGYTGLCIGVGVVELLGMGIDSEMFRNPEVNFRIAITALFILGLGGILAGLIPANRAVKIRPVEALRGM